MNELPTSEQTIGQPAQFQSTVEQPQSMERKNTLIRGALILLYLTIVISGGHRLFKTNSPEESAPQQQIIETSTASPEITFQEKSKPLFYVRDWQLWQSENGIDTQLSSAGRAVQAFKSSPDGNFVAYTVGDLQENSANYKFVYPNTLFLLNTETNQQTEIFSLDVTTELEYVHRLVDLAFSRDGKQLAFSTTNNVYLHSLETNTTESLFGATTSKQVKNTAGSPIYGYSGMSFSPTDTHLYVRRGFYEGMEPVVVSMETKAEVSVPLADELGGYGGYILDWYDENSLVAVKDLDAEPGFSTTALLQLSILDQNFKQIATVHQNHALYGGYQMGALQLFAVPYTLQEGEETSEILWLTVDAQEPSGLKQIASFKNEPGVGAEMFEMLDENIVLLQAFDPSLSYGKLYTFNKATNKLQLVADDARLSNWK